MKNNAIDAAASRLEATERKTVFTAIAFSLAIIVLSALLSLKSYLDTTDGAERALTAAASLIAAQTAAESMRATFLLEAVAELNQNGPPGPRPAVETNRVIGSAAGTRTAPAEVVSLGSAEKLVDGKSIFNVQTGTPPCALPLDLNADPQRSRSMIRVLNSPCGATPGTVYFYRDVTTPSSNSQRPRSLAYVGLRPGSVTTYAKNLDVDPGTHITVYSDDLYPISDWPGSEQLVLPAAERDTILAALKVSPVAKFHRQADGQARAGGVAVFVRPIGSPVIVAMRAEPESSLQNWRVFTTGLVLLGIICLLACGYFWFRLIAAIQGHRVSLRDLNVLQEQKSVAENENRAKSEYLAIMSHEIRTSMSGVLGMAEFMLQSKLYKEQHTGVSVIYDAGKNLVQIINRILDFSKIESGKVELSLVSFEPGELLTRVADLFTKAAQNKHLTLEIVKPSTPIWVSGDDLRIRQILSNFVGNALKFTEVGGVVLSLSAAESPGSANHAILRFEVKDSGPGIPEQMLPELFQPFHQLHTSIARDFGGTGLGLSICKRLSDLMGGVVGVESTLGEGSTFFFEIECRRLIPERLAAAAAEPEAATATARSAPASILLVEDNLSNQNIAKMYLERDGYSVTCADDGVQAVDIFKAGRFDVILMDGSMPEMDGYEATRRIRAFEQETGAERTPIIATTANTGDENEAKCLNAGMDDFVPKPYRFSDLKVKINKWLNQAPADAGARKNPSVGK